MNAFGVALASAWQGRDMASSKHHRTGDGRLVRAFSRIGRPAVSRLVQRVRLLADNRPEIRGDRSAVVQGDPLRCRSLGCINSTQH